MAVPTSLNARPKNLQPFGSSCGHILLGHQETCTIAHATTHRRGAQGNRAVLSACRLAGLSLCVRETLGWPPAGELDNRSGFLWRANKSGPGIHQLAPLLQRVASPVCPFRRVAGHM